jgi:hypothetical protein
MTGDARELDRYERLMAIAEQLTSGIAGTRDASLLADQVARLQQGVWALTDLLAATPDVAPAEAPAEVLAVDEGAPRLRQEATDATGTVRVVVATDGLPESIEIGEDWRRTVGSEGLAAAVSEACKNAVFASAEGDATPVAEPVETDREAVLERADQIVAYVEGAGPLPPGVATLDIAQVHPRSLSRIVDELLQAADAVDSLGTQWVMEEPPSDGHGRISLTVGPFGLVSCTADPDWVGRRETTELMDDLAAALRSARSRHASSPGVTLETALSALPDLSTVFAELEALRADYENPR